MTGSVSCVILAGGANKRFNGLIKANIVFDGVTIISGILEKVSGFFDEIIVVTNSPEEFIRYKGITIKGDIFMNAGPLGGIHAALKLSSCRAVFVVAGDMPLLNTGIIERQIDQWERENCEVLVPRVGKNIEPLHAVYSKSLLASLEKYLEGDNTHAVREFFGQTDVCYFDLEDNEEVRIAFANINYPSDLDTLLNSRKKC